MRVYVNNSIALNRQARCNYNDYLNLQKIQIIRIAMSSESQSVIKKRTELQSEFDCITAKIMGPTPADFNVRSVQLYIMGLYEQIADLKCDGHDTYMVEFNLRYIQLMNSVAKRLGIRGSGVSQPNESQQIEELAASVKSVTIESAESQLELHASHSDIGDEVEPESHYRPRRYLAELEWPRAKQQATIDEGASRPT